MRELIQALEDSVRNRNWYGALFVALSLPDVCGKIDMPAAASQARYTAWFEKYVQPKYIVEVGPEREQRVFLSGSDCYAFRCALLHEGSGKTAHHKSSNMIDEFQFVAVESNRVHRNIRNKTLQLQVDLFCLDVRDGVNQWLDDIASDSVKLDQTKTLLAIHELGPRGIVL